MKVEVYVLQADFFIWFVSSSDGELFWLASRYLQSCGAPISFSHWHQACGVDASEFGFLYEYILDDLPSDASSLVSYLSSVWSATILLEIFLVFIFFCETKKETKRLS